MTIPDSLRIRPMAERDLDAVMAIERGIDSAPHWNESVYLALIEPDGRPYLKRSAMVAEVAAEVIGFAICRLVADVAELESIVVAPNWHGRGLGRLLLSECVRQVKGLGAFRFDLEVRESNAAAIRLYRGAGFVETARRRTYYSDPEEDAVLMSVIL
jgi:ribosomal-protein-alanine N-acetyltransferase